MPEVCPSPLVVQIQPTWMCNLRCRTCRYWSETPAGGPELSTGALSEFLTHLAGVGTPQVWFVDGEPLLRTDLPALVARAQAAGLQARID